MREILFRGKQVDNDSWVYGYYTLYANSHGVHPCILTGTESGCVIPKFIDQATLGQYINACDRNGKKIFEGDLLKGNIYPFFDEEKSILNYFAEVIWSEECAGFELVMHKFPKSKVKGISDELCVSMNDFDGSEWEVIGNIYDNPELLNKARDIK